MACTAAAPGACRTTLIRTPTRAIQAVDSTAVGDVKLTEWDVSSSWNTEPITAPSR